MQTSLLLDAAATARALPYPALARAIADLLADDQVRVPARLVQPLPGGGSLFVMPAHDAHIAITKLITFIPDNSTRQLPSIQGDIVIFDARSGQRRALIDGPTVTARRTAAVSLLAAQTLAARRDGPLLIVGAGVQGRAHLEAFQAGLGIKEVWVHSRGEAGREALLAHARQMGLRTCAVDDPDAALAECPLVVTATPAQQVVMRGRPRQDAFIAAVGAFTPRMLEWEASVCRDLAARGTLVVDTRDADHEAGDLLQAGIAVSALATLAEVLTERKARGAAQRSASPQGLPAGSGKAAAVQGPVFFKSCGWAGWDLAAARCVMATLDSAALAGATLDGPVPADALRP